MSLNPQYVPLYQLQQYFVDKVTGAPLAGGRVYFYSDINRTVPKTVYELSSTTGSYTYVPLPNPIVLSSVGTPVDNNGNDIVIYAYPYNVITGESELYYVVVQDSLGRPQFTREAVPGISGSGTPSGTSGLFNYIPNGQFLAHTNLPNATGALVAGSNIIAQGGFSVELPTPVVSTNVLVFEPLGFTENPENSPRWEAVFTCVTPSAMDAFKIFRVKFNDVNKFSANDNFYTFGFWADGNVNIPVSIQIYKYFGTNGTVLPAETIFTDTIIANEGNIYQYQFQFGTNEGYIVDTVNNNDFIAIDIAFPTNIGFSVQLTNFVLVLGQQTLIGFPEQSNADMIARGVDGSTDVPNPNGYDLYLPKILTRYGYEYDYSQIGQIQATLANIPSPNSPDASINNMLLDGSTYLFDAYSTIGVPYSRLGNFLIANSPVANTPLFGTGDNFATAYVNNADDAIFRLTVNSSGAGVNYAGNGVSDFTGFIFTGIPTYNGSITGSATLNYSAFTSGVLPNQIICKSTFPYRTDVDPPPTTYVSDSTTVGTQTGFTFTSFDNFTGLYAYQTVGFSIDTLAASTLIKGPGNPGATYAFWINTNRTLGYYIWFNITGEIDPGPPALTGTWSPIEVFLNSTDTDVDVANTIREVMSALQSTDINVDVIPPNSSYFVFQTNPSSIQNYYVWYNLNGTGVNPGIGGSIGIEVIYTGLESTAELLTKTLIAINKYQYAVPQGQGMFLRNADPTGLWDFDNLTRWSNVTGVAGPAVGTFEYSQVLLHDHFLSQDATPAAGSSKRYVRADETGSQPSTATFGGSETRPVNMYVNYYIKY
jgi:hypothetical protein